MRTSAWQVLWPAFSLWNTALEFYSCKQYIKLCSNCWLIKESLHQICLEWVSKIKKKIDNIPKFRPWTYQMRIMYNIVDIIRLLFSLQIVITLWSSTCWTLFSFFFPEKLHWLLKIWRPRYILPARNQMFREQTASRSKSGWLSRILAFR
jgi:hypothetical protein